MSTPPLPKEPSFEKVPTDQSFINGYQNLLEEILAIAKGGKPGIALNEIVYKLMPYVQNYNMEYTQGNIANGQKAASYALSITNYIANEYQKAGAQPTTTKADAEAALKAMKQFENFLNTTSAWAHAEGIGDPFGSMGDNAESQLEAALGGKLDASDIDKYWTESWKLATQTPAHGKTPAKVSTNGMNSAIMQAINGAQNQSQSEAAYLQSESKLANESYQKYAATEHDIAQNIVTVEKAAVSAAQSAGN